MENRMMCALSCAAAFSFVSAPASGFRAWSHQPVVGSSPPARIMGGYGARTKIVRIWGSPSDFDGVTPSVDSEGCSRPSARDPQTFYGSKLDTIQDEIAEKQAKSREIRTALLDAQHALKHKKSYLGITDMEKLSPFVEELYQYDINNDKEIEWLSSIEYCMLSERGLSWPRYTSQNLLGFGKGLTNATWTGNLLQLPDGVFFLGHPSLGSKMFVRPCYSELVDLIVAKLDNDGIRRNLVLTGTPGTGKNMFALFLLYCLRLDGKTVVLDFKNKWYRFSDDKGVERGTRASFRSAGYLDDESSWLLCDPSSRPYERRHGATVLMASPNIKETYHEFVKELSPDCLFMPPWTLPELEQCRELVFPHVPKENVEESFDTIGGLPRAAFNRTVMLHLKSEIERHAASIGAWELDGIFRTVNCPIIGNELGDDFILFHMLPDHSEEYGLYGAYTIYFASEYARLLIAKDLPNKLAAHAQEMEQNKEVIEEIMEKLKKMSKNSYWSSDAE